MTSVLAQKHAAEQATDSSSNDSNTAKSVALPFSVVDAMVDLSVPLRRPKKRAPSLDTAHDEDDVRALREALDESEETIDYEDFRRDELGL